MVKLSDIKDYRIYDIFDKRKEKNVLVSAKTILANPKRYDITEEFFNYLKKQEELNI